MSKETSSVPSWAKYFVAAAAVGIVAVVIQTQRGAATQEAWSLLADPEVRSGSIEALENARERARGAEVEPFIAWELAWTLYDTGGDDNFERARQVARETLAENSNPAVAGQMRELLAALDSYQVAPATDA